MLKGINRQVVEVTNTESPYFERIVFFVRPEKSAVPEPRLRQEAETLSKKLKRPPKVKLTPRRVVQGLGFALLGAGAGAALTFLMGVIA